MAEDFSDRNQYNYVYDQPYYYQQQPSEGYHPSYNMQQGTGVHPQHYPPGWNQQNWQGYAPQQAPYNSYQAPGAAYGFYNNYGNQGYNNTGRYDMTYAQDPNRAGNQGPVDPSKGQWSRGKHSYSQNRSKNRQRPDSKLNVNAAEYIAGDINANTNTTNDAEKLAEAATEIKVEASRKDTDTNNAFDKTHRGRFHGKDSRTKTYDGSQQNSDRQKPIKADFNTNQNSDIGASSDSRSKGGATGMSNFDSDIQRRPQSTRPKSYRDSRANKSDRNASGAVEKEKIPRDYNRDDKSKGYRGEEKTDKHRRWTDNDNNQKSVTDDSHTANVGARDDVVDESGGSLRELNNGSRKKKENTLFTSSGHRDWPNKVAYTNQKEARDRYNYRGQDYNKRHKQMPSASNTERGGEQTKLSAAEDGSMKEEAGKNDNSVKETGNQRKSAGSNLKGSSRFRNKGKVDESQRGVLIEQLTKGSYECMVCCETVRAQNAIWGCNSCFNVFHLRCIKKWARSPNAYVSGTDKDGWRCPGCQNLSFKFPNQYRCFCGKVRDPELCRMDTPHSCGDVCQKERGAGCKHPCNILCHPGPCPECAAIVTKSCDCGKTKQTVKCGLTSLIKCEQVCERQLNCGKHFCTSRCHAGSCDKCEETIVQECYGKHETREITCGAEESFSQSYSCQKICSKILDCGDHTCDKPCHEGDCESCPTLPANVTHCPCGATPLSDLTTQTRTSCLDAIPTCDHICKKSLECGPPVKRHQCQQTCHEGACGPCSGTTMLTCRCLFKDQEFKCSEISQFTDENHVFLCDKRCNRKKLCSRHKCSLPCCVKEEHPCDQLCGRKLSCGLHKCDEPCHRNNCPPCLMAGFDELTCHCGSEVLFPPIPCGTKPPECLRVCTRQHDCSHTVRHNCHSEEKCPPCTELTKKMCMGNHVMRSNIPCHLTDISCGMKCSKPLLCGEHSCIKTCHKGGCLDEGELCNQPCRRKREQCEHGCGIPCHGETPCPPSPCRAKALVKCACGHREAQIQCTPDASEYNRLSMLSLKDSLQLGTSSVNISKLNKIGTTRLLECNEECAVLERNRRMALALEIQNPDLSAKLGSPAYSDFLKDYTKQNTQFVAGIEKALADLVQSAKQSKQPSRSHAFPSMNNPQRRVVHELAEFYGCETQSYDFEPKKNVVATAVKDRCWLPSLTLTAHIQRELHPRAPPPIPHVHKEEDLRLFNQAAKQSTSVLGESGGTSSRLAEGWQVIGKKSKKPTGPSNKSAIATIDKFEENLADICTAGKIDYESLSSESKKALKSEPVVDYFDFTVS